MAMNILWMVIIPHMKLFYQLKQQFPDLKDNDVNESIQKFGLNRDQCEVDLQQKSAVHHGGYYGPWGRNKSNCSSNNCSTVTSPHSELDSIVMSPSTTIHHTTTTFHYIDAPPSIYSHPSIDEQTNVEATADIGWHPAVSCVDNNMNTADLSPEMQQLFTRRYINAQLPPNSAPVLSSRKEPFSAFNIPMEQIPSRRWSEETGQDVTKALLPTIDLENQFQRNLSLKHSINGDYIVSGSAEGTTSPSVSKELPAIVQEQLRHKEKLEQEIASITNEKFKLTDELSNIEQELQIKIQKRIEAASLNVQKIGEIQENNQRLQTACDQMEAVILQSGQTLDTEQDCYTTVSQMSQMRTSTHLRDITSPPLEQSTRDSPLSTVSSGNNTPLLATSGLNFPSRPAPPPPLSSSLPANHQSTMGRPMNEPNYNPRQDSSERVGWSCSKCTYFNAAELQMCEMCTYPHYSVGTEHSNEPHSRDKLRATPCYCRHHHDHCHLPAGYE